LWFGELSERKVIGVNGIGLRGELEELLGTVDDVARRSVVRLSPHQTIGEAARELEEHDVSGARSWTGTGWLGWSA
jgi:hypothetical protein